jgi:uncharacterized DUF497 family protein
VAFEWDEEKRAANLQDHGVDFEDAALIFAGPVIEAYDTRVDYGEPPMRAVGQVDGAFFMVAYIWRGRNRRIISAWSLDDDSRKRYETILSRRP